jgi:hypothetical protein
MNPSANPLGTVVLDPLTTGAENGKNTHFAQKGNWDRGVDTLQELQAIGVHPDGKLNAYGDGSGQRTHGMTVLVREGPPEAWYEMRLEIGGYAQLSPEQRMAALLDNANWRRVTATSTPSAGGAGTKGVKLSFPGRYSADNQVYELPPGTKSLDVKTGGGRELEPEVDYTLNLLATPPTVTITLPLAQFAGVRLWGYYYLSSPTRTKVSLGTYDAEHTHFTLAPGVRDVSVFFGTGLELEPEVDYTYDASMRLLALTADLFRFSGKRIWLWAYN